jgi:hypothetical protein
MRPLRYAAALLWLVAGLVIAADTLHIIDLRHRPASEIDPLVRPLLRADEGMTGSGYQLFLRASQSRRDEIARFIAAFDVAARQLTITVRQSLALDDKRQRDAVSGEVGVGSRGRIIVGEREGAARGRDSVRIRTERRSSSSDEMNLQTIRVQDGKRAFLRVGQSVAVVEQIIVMTGRGPALASQGLATRDLTTGFDVLPRVRGEFVLLEITPRLAGPNTADGTLRFQELQTTVTARLGEWIDLGSVVGQTSDVHRAILQSGSTQSGERASVALKVE